MPTKKELELQIENLKKELNLYKNKPQLGRSYSNCLRENKQLKEENEILKEKVEELEDFDSKLSEQRLDEIIELEGRVKELDEENYELKNCSYEEYCNLVDENKLIKEFVDLKNELGEISELNSISKDDNIGHYQDIIDELKEDLEDYKLFCDAFDVPCAMEAIHNHWRNLPDESKEELTQKGLNPK